MKKNAKRKYMNSRKDCGFGFGENFGNKPKCSKCGKEGQHVGRNFRHCRNEKHWKELEEKIKNGNINLQTDFRLYHKKLN
jgi:hypothetical protein